MNNFSPGYKNGFTPFFVSSQSIRGTQSPSVSESGSLWSQNLMEAETPQYVLRHSMFNETTHNTERARKNQAAIELLRSWREEGDKEEQRETWEYLKKVLDEDRLSDRKLFP